MKLIMIQNNQIFLFCFLLLFCFASVKKGNADELKVDTGIVNTGELTVNGNINIDVNIASRADELIDILNIRATKIIDNLKSQKDKKGRIGILIPKDYRNIDEEIDTFKRLHQAHVAQLQKGNFVAAHEILIDIHELSFMDVVRKNSGTSYFCSRMEYVRGSIITGYITNEWSDKQIEKYILSPKEQETNEKKTGCGPSYEMAKPESVNSLYRYVLSSHGK